jgi:citrate lyase subunit beta / citryl-CoA lyase
VPATRPELVAKALASGADLVVVDLEDAVAADDKTAARRIVAGLPARPDVVVRCNPPSSPDGQADLEMLGSRSWSGGLVLPKAESADEVAQVVGAIGGSVTVLALIESAVGLCRAEEIAAAEGVVRLAFGAVDYQRDLDLPDDERGLDHPRSVLAIQSRVAGLPAPVDGPVLALDDAETLRASARRARALGMRGKFCIHPRQVPVVNEAFSVTAAELAWARRIVAAADEGGAGVLRVDGQMVDRPVVERARRMVAEPGLDRHH